MMRTIIGSIKVCFIAMTVAVASTSCLDKVPTDAIESSKAISNVDEANQAVIGIYADYKSAYLYSGNLTLLPDIQADLVYAVNGYSNTYGDIWRWNIQPSNSDIEAVYGALYKVIGDCNYFFEQVAKWENTLTDDDAYDRLQEYKGEVYFARALAYSELIKCFCKAYKPETAANELGVVLVSSYSNPGRLYRSSLEASYQFVLDDLDKAETCLKPDEDELESETYYNNVYFSYYAVLALRARVDLYMENWQGAVDMASEIIDSKKFVLSDANTIYSGNYSYYDYMWQYDQSTEIIWKVGFTATSYGGALGQIFLNYDWSTYRPDYVPGSAALALYDANDLRYNSFFGTATTGYSHALTWPLLIKYNGNQEFIQNYSILHVSMPKVFRLSEQYLIRAEAYCRLGNFNKAAEDLTTLRKARYSSYGSAMLSQDTWLDEISDERVRELFMEGFRLNDLKRWGRGFEREPQEQSLSDGSSLKVTSDNPLFVWPIPQREIDLPDADIEPNESNK